MSTCQICAREIKANTGLIAHHGYSRPGDGYQTSSCPGARHVPYEVGHDALDLWIESLERWIPESEQRLTHLKSNPPERYDVRRTDAWGCKCGAEPVWAERPADFAWQEETPYEARRPQTYANAFYHQVWKQERQLKQLRSNLTYAKKRREEWRP